MGLQTLRGRPAACNSALASINHEVWGIVAPSSGNLAFQVWVIMTHLDPLGAAQPQSQGTPWRFQELPRAIHGAGVGTKRFRSHVNLFYYMYIHFKIHVDIKCV